MDTCFSTLNFLPGLRQMLEEPEIQENKPWTKWTRKERRRILRKRRHDRREKNYIFILFTILILVTLWGLIYSITSQQDPVLIFVLLFLFVAVLITGAFFMQHILYDTE